MTPILKVKNWNVSWLFGFIICLLFSVIYFHNYIEKKFFANVEKFSLSQNWDLLDDKRDTIKHDLALPYDLLNKHDLSSWNLNKTLQDISIFDEFTEPAIVLGKVGGSDSVSLNGCFIGKTGWDENGNPFGWWWGKRRVYRIPSYCIDKMKSEGEGQLRIHGRSVGIANQGVYAGPIGMGEYVALSKTAKIIELLRYGVYLGFGVILLFLSLYYFFVYILVPGRSYNGIFAITCFCVGVYEIFLSCAPYRYFNELSSLFKVNALNAILGHLGVVWFFINKYEVLSTKYLRTIITMSLMYIVFCFFQSDVNGVWLVYNLWFPFFLISIFILTGAVVRSGFKNEGIRKYRWVLVLFGLTSLIDVISATLHADIILLTPYGFFILMVSFAINLAEEYSEAFIHVESLVRERTDDLAKALGELRDMEKVKQRFFANISHDFKTPIAVALGSLDEVKSELPLSPKGLKNRAIYNAERSLNQLLKMVGDLLDLSKAESGRLELEWRNAPISELLRQWIEPYKVLCKQKQLKLELDVEGCAALKIPMDVRMMERVFQNIISNAIKFTDYNKQKANQIKVSLTTDGARCVIDIEDSGMGIPDSEKEHIFDRYVQSSRTSLHTHGGSGIGLSFVKEVVDLHNGEVAVGDSHLGGTQFKIVLPLSQETFVASEYASEYEGEQNDIWRERESLDVAYPNTEPQSIDKSKNNVLLVEDNPEIAQITYAALQDHYNIYFASDGMYALELFEKFKVDCIVTDIVMPRMRGDELVREIRGANTSRRDIPIIVLSSQGDEDTVIQLLDQGANDFVSKPFKKEILKSRVRSQTQIHQTAKWIAQNEKIIELGLMANGMAHQIRNGLNSMRNQVSYYKSRGEYLLTMASQLDDRKKVQIGKRFEQVHTLINKAIDRISLLTESVNIYSSKSKEPVDIKLDESIDLCLSLLEDKVKKSGVEISRMNTNGVKFEAYPTFHEVIINLVSNAIDACNETDSPRITIEATALDDATEINISDNGKGIDPEVINKLCQPFFTTKKPGEGTGLGLFVVRDIVQIQHGGRFEIYSNGSNQGARFYLSIPKAFPKFVDNDELSLHGIKMS